MLPFAGGLELLAGRPLAIVLEVHRLDLASEVVGVAVTDAAAQPALHVVVDDPGQAAKLLLDGLGLADEYLQHPVLHPLGEDEIVTVDLRGRLELAVDAAVPLLDAARVPGQVEVKEVGAMGLEVQALAGCVGRDQDAQGILRRIGVEPALYRLAPAPARQAVDDLDALVCTVGVLDGLLQDVLQIALRPFAVLREDQDATQIPLRRVARRSSSEGREPGALVLTDPVDEPAGLGVRQVPGCLGDRLHSIEKLLLVRPEGGFGVVRGVRLGHGRQGLDLPTLLRFALLGCPLPAFVVGIRRRQEELGVTFV